jgi:hypothetical protein
MLQIEEAVVGPVAGGYEENDQKDGTVYARTIQEVGGDEEEEDEERRGVGGDEQEGQPAVYIHRCSVLAQEAGMKEVRCRWDKKP